MLIEDNNLSGSGTTLPPPAVSETDPTSAHSEALLCKDSKYSTVVYITGHRSFWLLPQGVVDKIETSADRLKAAAMKDTLNERLAALEKAGLTDLFLPATPQSFLLPAQQNEWAKLKEENRSAHKSLERLAKEQQSEEKKYFDELQTLGDGTEYYRDRLSLTAEWRSRFEKMEREKQDLRDDVDDRQQRLVKLREEGLDAAKQAGFEVVNGDLYSPEQIGIKALLENYLTARQEFENGEFDNEYDTAIFINTLRYNKELMAFEWEQDTPSRSRIEQYLTELNLLEGKMLEYATAVLDLANIGIATPEYALANSENNVSEGIIELARYKQLQWDIESLTNEMRDTGSIWHRVVGRNGPAPASELLQYQVKIEECESQQEELRCVARERAEAIMPPKMFVWHPNEYQANPYKSLMRPGIPLREFSMPNGGATLRHFSLFDLPGGTDYLNEDDTPNSPSDLAVSLKAAQKPGKDEALEKLLTDLGAKKYPLQEHWFDKKGLFVPDRFFQAIEHECALFTQNKDNIEAWGSKITSLLFESEAQRHLMGFDDSYTAQFTRLILSGISGDKRKKLQDQLNIEVLGDATGPSSGALTYEKNKNKKLSYNLTEASIGIGLTYRQGQLDLLSMNFPKPEEAQPVLLPFYSEKGKHELDVGRFYCALDVKCWGSVGARILLSHSIGVEAVEGQGIQITGIDPKKRELDGAEFEAFAGAQAGLMARAEMKWAIPARLRNSEKWRLVAEDVPEWMTMGLVTGELVGAAGIGASGNITIGLRNKRLVYYAKGKVVAGLGGSGSVGVEVSPEVIPLWMRLIQQELHENGYRRITWIDPEAFRHMSMLMNLCLSTALKISFMAAQGYDFVEELYDNFYSSENAGVVAVRISDAVEIAEGRLVPSGDVPRVTLDEYKSWFMGLQPEAIGPMLYNLVSEPVEFEGGHGQEPKTESEILKAQQVSILECLRWMSGSELVWPESYRGVGPNRIQRQFEESVTRMNINGEKPDGDLLLVARNNIARLDEFMGKGLESPSDEDRYEEYRRLRKKFSLHMWR